MGLSKGSLHHLEFYTQDLARSRAFWGRFLTELGYSTYQKWESGCSYKHGSGVYVVFAAVQQGHRGERQNRQSEGFNHLALHAGRPRRADADPLLSVLQECEAQILACDDRHVCFEGPDGIVCEVFFEHKGLDCNISPIAAAETVPLRYRVLRPNMTPADCVYPYDEQPGALHVGAWCEGALVGVGTITCEPQQGGAGGSEWRIRGMAVDVDFRGCSVGRRLVDAMVEHAKKQGGRLVWCNARTSASGFYSRSGFRISGEEFLIEGIGPHYVMSKAI